MAGKGGGAWKVAYADFVTAMMAFFMVMWLTSQSPEVREAVADHFRNPNGKRMSGTNAKSVLPGSSMGEGNRRVVKSRGDKRTEEDAKDRSMTDEGDISSSGKIIGFELNSTELSEQGKKELLQFVPELEGTQHRIEVRGHAGNNGGNASQATFDAWTLSFRRAFVVSQFLIDHGIDPRRIRPSAAGHSEPRFRQDQIDTDANSRVEVFVLKEVYEDPASKVARSGPNPKLDQEAKRMADAEPAPAKAAKADSHGH